MKRMLKAVLSVALIACVCTALLQPALVGLGAGGFTQAFSEYRRRHEHEELKKQAMSDSSLSIVESDDTDYYCEPDSASVEFLSQEVGFVNDELILIFNEDTSFGDKLSVIDSLGGKVVGYTFLINKYQIKLAHSSSLEQLEQLCNELMDGGLVDFASPNMAFGYAEAEIPDDPWTDAYGGKVITGWSEKIPNDLNGDGVGNWLNTSTLRAEGNWWLRSTETVSAWDYSEYFKPIKVGIVDSGFDTEHEELAGKFSFPSAYLKKTNRPSSHGTHVAGIIAATANNQKGISGICQTAQIIGTDWLPDDGQFSWSTAERILTGFISVVKQGAKVINFSLGSSGTFKQSLAFFWNIGMKFEAFYFSYVFAKLLDMGYDFIIVQSAGNGDGKNIPCDAFYNGSFSSIKESTIFRGISRASKQDIIDRIIIVGSAAPLFDGENYYQSSFSNIGESVDVCAPGSDIYSCDISDAKYCYKSGTSMAAPVVTGITAMTWSVNPELTGAQIKNIVCSRENSKYDAIVYYHKEVSQDAYPFINAKLCVEAAMRLSGIEVPEQPQDSAAPAFNATPENIARYANEVGE